MADDRDGTPAFVECGWFVVFGNDRSAENRLDPEHREEPGRHACAGHGLRFRSVATEVGVPGPVGRGAREEIGLLRPIGEVEIRDVAVGDARRRIFAFEVDDAFRFGNGNGRSRTPLTRLKMAVFAPMPSATVRIAIAAKAGAFANLRSA